VSLEWTELSITGSVPTARCGHSATMVEKRLLVFGGRGISPFVALIFLFLVLTNFWCTSYAIKAFFIFLALMWLLKELSTNGATQTCPSHVYAFSM
jgi:hypothetical protein